MLALVLNEWQCIFLGIAGFVAYAYGMGMVAVWLDDYYRNEEEERHGL